MVISPHAEARFWSHVDKSGECWTWTLSADPRGYGKVTIGGKKLLAHRVAWELVHGAIPHGLNVLHHCDNPRCVRAALDGGHLFVGTQAENQADMVAKGRQASGDRNASRLRPWRLRRGSRNNRAKLDEHQVAELRRLAAAGVPTDDLALRYGVTRVNVNCIIRRFTWRHVGGPAGPTRAVPG